MSGGEAVCWIAREQRRWVGTWAFTSMSNLYLRLGWYSGKSMIYGMGWGEEEHDGFDIELF